MTNTREQWVFYFKFHGEKKLSRQVFSTREDAVWALALASKEGSSITPSHIDLEVITTTRILP